MLTHGFLPLAASQWSLHKTLVNSRVSRPPCRVATMASTVCFMADDHAANLRKSNFSYKQTTQSQQVGSKLVASW